MRRAVIHLVLGAVVASLAGRAEASPRRHHRAEPEAAPRHGASRKREPTPAEIRRQAREAVRADPCAHLPRSRRSTCERREEAAARAEDERESRAHRRSASPPPVAAKPKAGREVQPEDLVGGVESSPPPALPALRGALGADAPAAAAGRRSRRTTAAGRPGKLREVVLEDGQSLDDLAARTGVSVADLARLNGIASVDDAPTGMRLKLPSGAVASPAPSVVVPTAPARLASTPFSPPAAAVAEVPAPAPPRNTRRETASAGPSGGPRPYSSLGRQGASAVAPSPARRGGRTEADALAAYAVASARAPHVADREEARHERFVWPVRAEVTSAFGAHGLGRRNDGVDLAARPGDPVRASAAGEVVYAGKEIAGAGGNLVLLKHADGWVTAYSHLGRVVVAMRQTVDQGQEIAESPDVAGASVHFEVRQPSAGGAKPVDPVSVLPARGGGETGRG